MVDDPMDTTVHVRRAAAGDLTSIDWLVTRLAPGLIAQARYRLGPRLRHEIDPEELVDEAWLTALPRLAELTASAERVTPTLLRFLSTAIVHRTNNLLRRDLHRSVIHSDTAALGNVSAEVTGVVTAAVRRETRTAVLDALDQLDSLDQEILILRGIEQRANDITATLLGITPTAASMRYTRALARLERALPASLFSDLVDS